MKKGCTLADVIFTLGVLGIVASITLPTVFKNIQDRPSVKVIKTQEKIDYDFTR